MMRARVENPLIEERESTGRIHVGLRMTGR